MADTVTLDVGGVVYKTTHKTLTRYIGSKLNDWFDGKDALTPDNHGHFCIDRDGAVFRHILNYLRHGKLVLPEDFNELEILKEEATFYKLDGLVSSIERAIIQRQRGKETLEVKYFHASEHHTLRGEKRTLGRIKGRLASNGNAHMMCESSQCHLTDTFSDIIEASITRRSVQVRVKESNASSSESPCHQQDNSLRQNPLTASAMTNMLFSVLSDHGFTLTTLETVGSDANHPDKVIDYWLFVRSR